MIKDKKKNFVIGKLNDNIGKPKELWKSFKKAHLQRFVLRTGWNFII